MKVIIAGSRDIGDYETVVDAIKESNFEITEVVCGMAKGPDLLGRRYAIQNRIKVTEMPAEWRQMIPDANGLLRSTIVKSAGHQRNLKMALYGDALIAIWDGTSKGTRGMIDIAKRKGLRIYVKMVNGINKIPQSLMSPPNCRFVFGSNDKGIHGKGAALDAKTFYGAAKFHGRGFTGKCYAIATKDKDFVRHRIEDVSAQIRHLITVEGVTEENKKLKFLVTRVGCGYAGFTDEQMAPLWANSPENFYFPPEWKKFGYKSWADIQ